MVTVRQGTAARGFVLIHCPRGQDRLFSSVVRLLRTHRELQLGRL